ncbi:hypothetical protein V6U90_28765 [Micromonospora sp. CPCC 206060]|uniref:hypothetical protein n=1 Tax=Micromonospora sp. CPCC 206060 TaxID=3122406 RepID=UPI002FF3862B
MTGTGLAPQQRLAALAATITATPGDANTDLPYAYLHTQAWTRATDTITRTDVRRWRHEANDSGYEISRRLPDLPGTTHNPTPDERDLFTHAREKTSRYQVGGLPPYLAQMPTDPTLLADTLAPRQLSGEPEYARLLIDAVVGLATSQYLNREQRAATLGVLAKVPGLAYLGQTTDLADRDGLAFAATVNGATSQIIIDPRTGEVLAAQEHVATGPRPGLFSHILILDRAKAPADAVSGDPERSVGTPDTTEMSLVRQIIDLTLTGADTAALDALRAADPHTRQQLVDTAMCLLNLDHELTCPHDPNDSTDNDQAAPVYLRVAIDHTHRATRMLHDPLDGVAPDIAAATLTAVSALTTAVTETVGQLRRRVMQSYPAAARGEYTTAPFADPTTELRLAANELHDLEQHLHQAAHMAAAPERTLGALTRTRPPGDQA